MNVRWEMGKGQGTGVKEIRQRRGVGERTKLEWFVGKGRAQYSFKRWIRMHVTGCECLSPNVQPLSQWNVKMAAIEVDLEIMMNCRPGHA